MSTFSVGSGIKIDSNHNRTNYIIFGFCREMEHVLHCEHGNDPFYNIPELVAYMILSYFFINEYFDIIGPDCTVSEDKYSIMKNKENSWNDTCYGHTLIPSTIKNTVCKWHLKIDSVTTGATIGISSKAIPDKPLWKNCCADGYHYCLWNNGLTGSSQSGGIWKTYRGSFRTGDVICVILEFNDGSNATLSYELNGENQGIADNIYIGRIVDYRLAISLCGSKEKVTIKKLEIMEK